MTKHALAAALRESEHRAFLGLVTITPGEEEDLKRLWSMTDDEIIRRYCPGRPDWPLETIEKIADRCDDFDEFCAAMEASRSGRA